MTDTYRDALRKAGDTKEDIYDVIMAEGKLVFLRLRDDYNPYAMHRAYEWMKKEIEERIED